ncbi:MAG: DUF817 domain-containing protein [Sphingobium sp.]|nr:DUF817 domain-containing protein [Sphingobium sp.]
MSQPDSGAPDPQDPATTGATRFARIRARLEAFEPRPGPQSWLYEFLLFGFKQGWACLFGALMLTLLLGTHFLYPKDAPLARYDFLTFAAITIQAGMLIFRLESWREAGVIAIFHLVGTVMELFKTSAGSWDYPEGGVLRIGAVPLFSGFMYAAVGSYIARIWRIFRIRLDPYPPLWSTAILAAAIYVNFFAHHWLPDMRIGLFVATALLFRRARFHFTPFRQERQMPVLLGFFLVALFIWLAENIGTFAHAWNYPSQRDGWHIVSIAKLGAWYLLMIISVVLVSLLHGGDGTERSDSFAQ